MQQLNKLCGNENLFFYTLVPRRRMPIGVTPRGVVLTPKVAGDGASVNSDTSIRSKIFAHFIKGKISHSPRETILMIPGELEHLENLVRLDK